MLHEMGHDTGIDLDGAARVRARRAGGARAARSGSHLLTAGPVDWHRAAS